MSLHNVILTFKIFYLTFLRLFLAILRCKLKNQNSKIKKTELQDMHVFRNVRYKLATLRKQNSELLDINLYKLYKFWLFLQSLLLRTLSFPPSKFRVYILQFCFFVSAMDFFKVPVTFYLTILTFFLTIACLFHNYDFISQTCEKKKTDRIVR